MLVFYPGEMAEWLKALVLKTSDVERHRGFESLSLRQQNIIFGMEKYPRGRRGSPAKGVGCDKRRPGSNPGFSAKPPERAAFYFCSFVYYTDTNIIPVAVVQYLPFNGSLHPFLCALNGLALQMFSAYNTAGVNTQYRHLEEAA